MSNGGNVLKRRNISFKLQEGVIEVRLRDDSFRTYFKREVGLNDKKGLRNLMRELRAKGVPFPFPVGWLESDDL